MTSNLGAKEIISYANGNFNYAIRKLLWFLRPSHWGMNEQDFLKDLVLNQLEKRFSPEFINRFDDIFVFQWLQQEVLGQILGRIDGKSAVYTTDADESEPLP